MHYYVTVGGRTFAVDVEDGHVRVDGRELAADLAGTGPLHHLLLDGAARPLLAQPGETRGAWSVDIDGHRFEAHVVDERTRAIHAMTGGDGAARKAPSVRAPMPGLIVRVEVEPGAEVRAGQGVIIMEAMKMENELRSDGAGVVAHVHVCAGQAVEKGAVLIEFEAT